MHTSASHVSTSTLSALAVLVLALTDACRWREEPSPRVVLAPTSNASPPPSSAAPATTPTPTPPSATTTPTTAPSIPAPAPVPSTPPALPLPAPAPAATMPAPQLAALAPPQGARGLSVAIDGSGFSATATDNIVRFNGERAQVVTATPQRLEVRVPEWGRSGQATVTVQGRRSNGLPFAVTNPRPLVHAVTPAFGTPATQSITLEGVDLGPQPRVELGGNTLNILSATSQQVTAELPAYLTQSSSSQGGSAYLETAHGRSNGFGFNHEGGLYIQSVQPNSAAVGEVITLQGLVRGSTLQNLFGQFVDLQNNDVHAPLLSLTPGPPASMTLRVPPLASSGSLHLGNGTDLGNPVSFRLGGPASVVSPQRHSASDIPWTVHAGRIQMLYTAAELGRGGTILGLGWEADTQGQGRTLAGVYRGCEVRLGHSSKTSLDAVFANNFDIGPTVLARSGDYALPVDRHGFVEIPLTATFDYNGKDNLVVEISHQGGNAINLWKVGRRQGGVGAEFRRVITGLTAAQGSASATAGQPEAVLHGLRLEFKRQNTAANGPTDRSYITVVSEGGVGGELFGAGPSRAMLRYTPQELGYRAGGVVQAIRFKAHGQTVAGNYQDVVLRLGHDSRWSSDTSFVLASLPHPVARLGNLQVAGGEAWLRLPLTERFDYANLMPLVIDIAVGAGSAAQTLEAGPTYGWNRLLHWPSNTASSGETQERAYTIQIEFE